jgi:hypothetical protein
MLVGEEMAPAQNFTNLGIFQELSTSIGITTSVGQTSVVYVTCFSLPHHSQPLWNQ